MSTGMYCDTHRLEIMRLSAFKSTLSYPSSQGRPIMEIYIVNRSQMHECRNWEQGHAVSFRGIHKSDLVYRVQMLPSPLAVSSHPLFVLYSTTIPTYYVIHLHFFLISSLTVLYSVIRLRCMYVFCHHHSQYSDIFSRCIYHVSFNHSILSSVCI